MDSAITARPLPGRALWPDAAEVFRCARSREFSPLLDPEDVGKIRSLTGTWNFPIESGGYEIGLAEGPTGADFALCLLRLQNPLLRPGAPGAKAFPGMQSGMETPWGRTRAFFERWGRLDSPLFRGIPYAWLAFDAGSGEKGDGSSGPCLSLCLDTAHAAGRMGGPDPAPMSWPALSGIVGDLHGILRGGPMPRGLEDILHACYASLPAGGLVKHVSFMLPRNPCTVKMNVSIPGPDAPAYLAGLGRTGLAAAARELIGTYLPSGGTVRLNLILWPSFTGHLELELLGGPGITADMRGRFLGAASASGLCPPEKARVLAGAAACGWLRPPSREAGAAPVALAWYAKLRYAAETGLSAKAYLALMPRMWNTPPPA